MQNLSKTVLRFILLKNEICVILNLRSSIGDVYFCLIFFCDAKKEKSSQIKSVKKRRHVAEIFSGNITKELRKFFVLRFYRAARKCCAFFNSASLRTETLNSKKRIT